MSRIGVIAWLQESNTFLARPTTLEHYEQDVLLTGSALVAHFADARHEIGGMLSRLGSVEGCEIVPIFAARAIPFGAMTAETHASLKSRLLDALRQAGRLDGMLVAPHGATVSVPVPDVDGDWLAAVREIVGPRLPIVGTLDPHANLSPTMVSATDALFAYQTNPHIDQWETGYKAADVLLRTLAGELQPVQRACFPPMAINIERQCTNESPLRQLCAERDHRNNQAGVLGASLLLGFPYADVAEMGSATLVVTDKDGNRAEQIAHDLAEKMWVQRKAFAGDFVSVADAVAKAAVAPSPVCLLDMGDNVGGGSPGDGTWIAHELHQRAIGPACVAVYDPVAVQGATAAGVGQRVTLKVGGKSDDRHGPPLTAEFVVQFLGDGQFSESEVRHGGFTHFDQGRIAIVTADSKLTVLLTSRRVPPMSLRQLTAFGLDPAAFRVLVAKGVNAPLAAYAPVCRTMIRVNTPGSTTADLSQLEFHHRRRPMFPFEPETEWHPPSSAK